MAIYAGPALGKRQTNPASSGYELAVNNPTFPSGTYWIKTGVASAVQQYVDMTYGTPYVENMFASGEQGAWYEHSLTNGTLFQDAAGTTPAVLEGPVGLMLDQSKQGVGRNGSKRVNLLSYTEQFDNAAWTKAYSTISPNSTTAPNGYTTANAIYETADNTVHICYGVSLNIINVSAGVNVTSSIYIKPNGRTKGAFSVVKDSANYDGWNVFFDLANKSFTTVVNATGMATSTSITGPDQYGFYKITTSGTVGTSLKARNYLGLRDDAANDTYLGDITKGFYIWGADLRLTSEAATLPAYQRIDADWSSTLPGNHATQSTSANRPVLSAKVNLFNSTTNMAGWTRQGISIQTNQAGFDGSNSAILINEDSTTGRHQAIQLGMGTHTCGSSGFIYKVRMKSLNIPWVLVDAGFTGQDGAPNYSDVGFFVNLSTGATGTRYGPSVLTPAVNNLGNGWWEIVVKVNISGKYAVLAGLYFGSADNTLNYTGDASRGVLVDHLDLRVANQSHLPYQRVNTATDYDADPIKFPPYLKFNGTNSWMVTGNIDFTGTDKMTVFAGVGKLSDTATGMLFELSNNTIGAFSIRAPQGSGAATYGISHRIGSSLWLDATTVSNFAAPITNVITAKFDASAATSASQITSSINGASASLSYSGTVSSGSYAFAPLYIGMRGGSSVPFNGNLYPLIIRGAATDATHITYAEKYVAYKTGVTL